jgi:DegV family protein with EDD domain
MGIKIITDTGSDLSKDVIKDYNIDIIPLLVYLDEKEYLDGIDIIPEELYKGMREGKIYKTGQVPATKFKELFSTYARNNESIIYIAFSSELSGTYQTAVMIKNQMLEEYPDFELEIIDSKCASVGQGIVVLKAARMAREGKTKEEIIEAIKFYSKHMEHIFTVDDLEYLYRGGRVKRSTAFIGSLLNIKPILNVEEGKLVPIEKSRGRKKLYNRIIEILEERGADLSSQTIGISHGDSIAEAELLKNMIEERFGIRNFYINIINAVIGAHSGPGTLAVFFLNEKPPM